MLPAFFVLTFLLSWSCWIAASAIWRETAASFSGWAHAGTLLYLAGVFAPALIAIALTDRRQGRPATKALLSRVALLPAQVRWFVFAISYMAVIKLIGASVIRIATGAWPAFGEEPIYLMLGAILISTPVQAGEEIGWRGFALPRLARSFGLGPASVMLGGIWALWHLPWFLMPGGDTFGQAFPIYWLQVTSLSVAMAWLYWRTNGSLFITMLFHAAVNNTKDIVPSVAAGAATTGVFTASPVAWTSAVLLAICTIYFLVRMRGAQLDESGRT